jgi:hypothetical protein
VKSLTAFPTVLAMLNEKLDMTQKLGDAFLAQQKEVLAAVQRLRGRADQAGNLKSSKEQNVTKAQEGGTTVIKIEPTNPQTVYVPTYTSAVYGPWPYSAYPPYSYYPGYVRARRVRLPPARSSAARWGGCGLGRRRRQHQHQPLQQLNKTNIQNGNWSHSAEHRKGAGYRDSASQARNSAAPATRRGGFTRAGSAAAPSRAEQDSAVATAVVIVAAPAAATAVDRGIGRGGDRGGDRRSRHERRHQRSGLAGDAAVIAAADPAQAPATGVAVVVEAATGGGGRARQAGFSGMDRGGSADPHDQRPRRRKSFELRGRRRRPLTGGRRPHGRRRTRRRRRWRTRGADENDSRGIDHEDLTRMRFRAAVGGGDCREPARKPSPRRKKRHRRSWPRSRRMTATS